MPLLSGYSKMKREAEDFLLTDADCQEHIKPIILRPGLVWHPSERSYTVPLKVATDIGYAFNKNFLDKIAPGNPLSGLMPQSGSIHLSVLAEFAINGALDKLPDAKVIWTNENMN